MQDQLKEASIRTGLSLGAKGLCLVSFRLAEVSECYKLAEVCSLCSNAYLERRAQSTEKSRKFLTEEHRAGRSPAIAIQSLCSAVLEECQKLTCRLLDVETETHVLSLSSGLMVSQQVRSYCSSRVF